jgi:hypothetical protein
MRRTLSLRSSARFAAIAMAAAMLTGCAQLHLTQGPDQIIQRTESQDNYDVKQVAGPTAARVLPYALLAEQAYDSGVYANHRMSPRTTDCISDDVQNCDTLVTLGAWRCGSTSGDMSGAVTARRNAKCEFRAKKLTCGCLGVQIWARKGKPCSEGVIAFRGTMQGNKGDWESNFHWILRAFPVYDQYDQDSPNWLPIQIQTYAASTPSTLQW